MEWLDQVKWDADGLVPVIAQEAETGDVLMFAYMNREALALTAVVITFALTTFLLALGYRSFSLIGHDEVQDDLEDRRIARGRRSGTALAEGVPGDAVPEQADRDEPDRDEADRDEADGAEGRR